MMNKAEISRTLIAHQQELTQYGVKSLVLFGSVARNEEKPTSDVDLLVEFRVSPGAFAFIRLNRYLEKLLHRKVDLVTKKALHSQLRNKILKEAIYAYQGVDV